MIQRVQSLFLLISIVATILTFFIPIGVLTDGINIAEATPYGVYDKASNGQLMSNKYFFYLPLALAFALTTIALMSFKNRKGQLKYLKFTFLLFAVTFVLMALFVNDIQNTLSGMKYSLGLGFFFPLIGVAFNWLAAKSIKKDEDLVRSVDRIR